MFLSWLVFDPPARYLPVTGRSKEGSPWKGVPSCPLKIGSLPVTRVEDGCDDCIGFLWGLSRKVKNSASIDGTPVGYCDVFLVRRGNNST